MDRDSIRLEINRQFHHLLLQSRRSANLSVAHAAHASGLSVDEFLAVEHRPAEVPVCNLYKVVKTLGADVCAEAEILLLNISLKNMELRRPRKWSNRLSKLMPHLQSFAIIVILSMAMDPLFQYVVKLHGWLGLVLKWLAVAGLATIISLWRDRRSVSHDGTVKFTVSFACFKGIPLVY